MSINADVRVDIGVSSKIRRFAEPFKPTITYSNTFQTKTSLDAYSAPVQALVDQTYNYIQAERAAGAEISLHIAITVDNPTHPPTAKGVVKLPKGHIDMALTDLDVANANVISSKVMDTLTDMRTLARY